MPEYVIKVPKSDTLFRVQYDPDSVSIDEITALDIGGIREAEIDPDGMYVAVPTGFIDIKIVGLREYLTGEAAVAYANSAADQAEWDAGKLEQAEDSRNGR